MDVSVFHSPTLYYYLLYYKAIFVILMYIRFCEVPQYKLFHSPDKNNGISMVRMQTAYIYIKCC